MKATQLLKAFANNSNDYIQMLTSLDQVILPKDELIALDIETNDLYGEIISAQFRTESSPVTQIVFSTGSYLNRDKLRELMIGHTFIIQNAVYEMSCISTQDNKDWWVYESPSAPDEFETPSSLLDDYYILKEQKKVCVICTLLAGRLALPKRGQGLEELYQALGIDPYRVLGIDKKSMAKSFNNLYMSQKQKEYAALDVLFLHELYHKIKAHTKSQPYILDIKATIVTNRRLTFSGYPVCRKEFVKFKKLNEARIAERQKRLGALNARSYTKCGEVLGIPSTGKYFLYELELKHGNMIAKDIREQRSDLKLESSYFNVYDRDEIVTHNDKRYDTKDFFMAYGNFGFTAKSGRGTCSKQNLQQVPKSLKLLYGTGLAEDNPEYVVVYSDYAALELKTIMANLAPRAFIEAHDKLLDPHAYVAKKLFDTDLTYEYILANNTKERWIGKLTNFLLLYGAGCNVLQQKIMEWFNEYWEEEEVQALIDSWFEVFPEMEQWHQDIWGIINKDELVKTALGRWLSTERLQDSAGNINQGDGSDVAKISILKLDEFMNKSIYQPQPDGRPTILYSNFVHDSHLFVCKNDPKIYKELCKDLVGAMNLSWEVMQPVFNYKRVEMVTSATVGFNTKQADSNDYIYKYEDIGNRQDFLDIERLKQAKEKGDDEFKNGPFEIDNNKQITYLKD